MLNEEKQKRKNEFYVADWFDHLDDEELENKIKIYEKTLHQTHPIYSLL